MGTEYKFFSDNRFGKLIIDEMSNRFRFLYTADDADDIKISNDITPEEMAKIFLHGLTICSYWMNSEELKSLIKKYIKEKIY